MILVKEFCKKNGIHYTVLEKHDIYNEIVFEFSRNNYRFIISLNQEDLYNEKFQQVILNKLCQEFDIPIINKELEFDEEIINKLASEFPYSISIVHDIYYKCDRSIFKTVDELRKRMASGT